MQREQLEQLLSSNSILRSTLLMLYLKTSKSSNFEDFHQGPLLLSPLPVFFCFVIQVCTGLEPLTYVIQLSPHLIITNSLKSH